MRPLWNHNIHYHPLLIEAVPQGASRVLDVGCGEGMLARALRAKAAHVIGIDLDAPSLALARDADRDGIEYVEGDFLTYPFEPASFDVLVSVATLHHVDAATGLRRMAELLKPGGVLAIVGLARDAALGDYALAVAAVLANRVKRLTVQHWVHPSPIVWPPPETWAATRAIAERELRGMRWRRHLYWRYSIVWTKPRS
jgi:2-polyprenyl-3-methyl-5-hydroxy-6-metoxy-1,4-benzoquinol methylase